MFRKRSPVHIQAKATEFLDMPNELILQIAGYLGLEDTACLLQANRFLSELLSTVLFQLALAPNLSLGRFKRSVLHWAAVHNRDSLMTLLLERGVSVNAVDKGGMTALHSAVVTGNEAGVKLLLEHGADPEICNKYWLTPLLSAVILGNFTITRMLLDGGANMESRGHKNGFKNALQYAAGFGNMAVVEMLISKGCNMGSVDWLGLNATQGAAASGHKEVVDWLLALGGTNPGFDKFTGSWSQVKLALAESILWVLRTDEHDCCRAGRPRRSYHSHSQALRGGISIRIWSIVEV